MDELREFFLQVLNEDLIQITLSGTRDRKRAEKVKVRPVLLKGTLSFQETLYRETKVYHVNYEKEEAVEKLLEYIKTLFRQAQVAALGEEATVLVSKKGAVSLKRRRKEVQQETGERDLANTRPRATFCRRESRWISWWAWGFRLPRDRWSGLNMTSSARSTAILSL